MPELPEVEIMARNVRRWASGRRVLAVEVSDEAVLRGAWPAPESMVGERVGEVVRRGKYLVMEVGTWAWVWHFRMTGKVVRAPGARRWRLAVHLEGGEAMHLVDARRLGHVECVPRDAWPALLASRGLGDEPWPGPRGGAWWQERLGSARGSLKTALMDQRRVAGLGNIAASEICFDAGLHPGLPPVAMRQHQWRSLAASAESFLDRIVREDMGEEITFVSEGRADSPFRVYRRSGEACPSCGALIRRGMDAGRATFWCPGCQPEPRGGG